MAGTISFLGLSGDQDYGSIVDAMVQIRKDAYLTPIEDKIYDYELKQETVSQIDSLLSSFYSTVRDMDRLNEFLVRGASSSDTSVFTASASSDAVIGSHTVTVNQLAHSETEIHQGIQNGIQYHTGVANRTDAINSSGLDKTFVYSYNGATYTNTMADGATMEDLQTAINDNASGVTASIVTYDGMDHLVLSEDVPDGTRSIVIDPDEDMTLDGTDATTDFTAESHTQVVNASGSDQVFEIQYGTGSAVEITVATGTTLVGLRDLINAQDLGLSASLLDDGSTGSGAAHLVLTGEDTGSDYAITLNPGSATTMDGTGGLTEDFTGGNFTETATAANSQIRVNGYPAGPPWIERATNTVNDVIEGVTLNLLNTGTNVSLAVTTDTTAIVDKIQAFAEGFNAVRQGILDATSYDNETEQAGTLIGNYAMKLIKTRLDDIVTGTVPGFQYPEDPYVSLQQLGFYTDAEQGSETEGQLLIDTDILEKALIDDPDAVAALFSSYLAGKTDSSQIRFSSALSTATAGVYSVEIDTDTQLGRFQLADGSWGEWLSLSGSSGNYTLTGMEGPEKGIALDVSLSAGTGTHTAQLQLQNGVAVSLNDELTTLLSTSGPTTVLDASYEDMLDNLTDQYDTQSQRLVDYEEMLVDRFSRLDEFVSRMNNLSTTINSMAGSLTKK